MPTKSLIEIDVNDSQFRRFQEYYDRYQTALGKQAQMWQKTGASTVAISNQFQKMTSQLLAQNRLKQEVDGDGRKQLTTLTQSERLWTSMSKTTKSVAGNLKDATLSLMKWAGIVEIVGGVLGVGGLFGINRMASNVAGMRSSAMGRGVSIGEQTAMKNFSQLGIDDSFLDTVAGIKADPTKQRALSLFGIDNSLSTADTTVAMLRGMRAKAQSTPASQLGMLDNQTGVSVGANVWRSLQTMSEKEFNQHLSDFQHDAKNENIGDRTAEGWANFNRAMQRAGETLQKTFVDNLGGLQKPLTELSAGFNKLLATIMQSAGVHDGIEKLGKWISEFAETISKGDFQKSVLDFIAGVEDMAETLKAWLHPVDTLGNKFANPLSSALGHLMMGDHSHNASDYADVLANVSKRTGVPKGILDAEFAHYGSKYGKNPFDVSENFARKYNINTDDPDQVANAVGDWMAEKYMSNPKLGWSGVTQAFDADQGVHVEVRVTKSNQPGNSTPTSVNQMIAAQGY